jgi:DNA-binding transcriptional LysR family regulator
VRPNVRVETPTGDLLVNQMRGGGLDVAMVYAVNARTAREFLDAVPIHDALAVAVQPFAVSRTTDHPHLLERLAARLRSNEGRARFEEAGFKPR